MSMNVIGEKSCILKFNNKLNFLQFLLKRAECTKRDWWEESGKTGARDRLMHMINFHCCTIRYVAFIFWYDFPLYCSFPDGPQRTISQYNWCWRGLLNHQAFFWWCTSTVIHHSSWSYQRECSYDSLLFQVLFFLRNEFGEARPDEIPYCSSLMAVNWGILISDAG